MWDSETDYRLMQGDDSSDDDENNTNQVYFIDEDNDDNDPMITCSAKDMFSKLFRKLTKGATVKPMAIDVGGQGRTICIPQASEAYNIAQFSFHDLCGTPKGAADYLAIGEQFHSIFVHDVPQLKSFEVNLVRRWITFIDSMYECHVKLVIHAATNPERMFEVDLDSCANDEVFAFDRTRSRMEEMRSEAYLRKKWVGRSSIR